VKRFMDEEDDSFDSSSDSGEESDESVGADDSDGDSANPYADGTPFPYISQNQMPTPFF
jgi:hypothetical protein